MADKKKIDEAIEAIGQATVVPIGKVEHDADGPKMSLVIGGLDQWASGTVEQRTVLFEKYLATGKYTRQEALMLSGIEALPRPTTK